MRGIWAKGSLAALSATTLLTACDASAPQTAAQQAETDLDAAAKERGVASPSELRNSMQDAENLTPQTIVASEPPPSPMEIVGRHRVKELIEEVSASWADFQAYPDNHNAKARFARAIENLSLRGVCWGKVGQPQSKFAFHRCAPNS